MHFNRTTLRPIHMQLIFELIFAGCLGVLNDIVAERKESFRRLALLRWRIKQKKINKLPNVDCGT